MSYRTRLSTTILTSLVLISGAILIWAYQTGKVTILGNQASTEITEKVEAKEEWQKGTSDVNLDLEKGLKLKYDSTWIAPLNFYVTKKGIVFELDSSLKYTGKNKEIRGGLVQLAITTDGEFIYFYPGDRVYKFDKNFRKIAQSSPPHVGTTSEPGTLSVDENSLYLVSQYRLAAYKADTQVLKLDKELKEFQAKKIPDFISYVFLSPALVSDENYLYIVNNKVEHSKYYYQIGKFKKEDLELASPISSLNLEDEGKLHLTSLGDFLFLFSDKGNLYKIRKDNFQNVISASFHPGSRLRDISTDGKFLYLSHREIGVSVVDPENLGVIKEVKEEEGSKGGDKIAAIKGKEKGYPHLGSYTSNIFGREEVSSFESFEPINENKPEGTSISYQFSGSKDNASWSEWSEAKSSYSTISLSGLIPEGSQYLKVKITLESTDSLKTPSLDGFSVSYAVAGVVPTVVPTEDGEPIPGAGVEPGQEPSVSDAYSEAGIEGVGKLVSTGTLLWFNILVALIIASISSYLLLRKKPS